MKKTISIALLLILGMTESTIGQLNLNFSAGINNSTCKYENIEEISTNGRSGYFIGVAPNYQINEKIQFQVDFQYSLKGYETDNSNSSTFNIEYRYGYLDIIPEIEYSIIKYIALGIGVNYGIKMNEQLKIDDQEWLSSNFEAINLTDFGLTGKLKVNFKNIFGFVRYNIGLKDISDISFRDVNGQTLNDVKHSNRNLQIGIGYKLNFKKG